MGGSRTMPPSWLTAAAKRVGFEGNIDNKSVPTNEDTQMSQPHKLKSLSDVKLSLSERALSVAGAAVIVNPLDVAKMLPDLRSGRSHNGVILGGGSTCSRECSAIRDSVFTAQRFLQSLELFEENKRKKSAIFTALTFSQKLLVLPSETVFHPLLKANLVAKGILLSFITDFFNEYLVKNNLKGVSCQEQPELLDRTSQTWKEGLLQLVQHKKKPMFEVKLTEMRSALTTEILEQAYVPKVIETVRHHMKEAKLPDVNIVCLL